VFEGVIVLVEVLVEVCVGVGSGSTKVKGKKLGEALIAFC